MWLINYHPIPFLNCLRGSEQISNRRTNSSYFLNCLCGSELKNKPAANRRYGRKSFHTLILPKLYLILQTPVFMGISGLPSIDWLNKGIRTSITSSAAILLFRAEGCALEMTGPRLTNRHYEYLWTQYFIFNEPVRISDRLDGAMQKKRRQL
jgi:hypothetical protein